MSKKRRFTYLKTKSNPLNVSKGKIDNITKKLTRNFKNKTTPEYAHYLDFRREFVVSSYMTSKNLSPEMLWPLAKLTFFLKSRDFAKLCLDTKQIPYLETGGTKLVLTEHVPEFLEKVKYNGEDIPLFPLYLGESLIKASDCAYFIGTQRKNLISFLRTHSFPFYYLSFEKINPATDEIDPNKVRFRIPEVFHWIDFTYDRITNEGMF